MRPANLPPPDGDPAWPPLGGSGTRRGTAEPPWGAWASLSPNCRNRKAKIRKMENVENMQKHGCVRLQYHYATRRGGLGHQLGPQKKSAKYLYPLCAVRPPSRPRRPRVRKKTKFDFLTAFRASWEVLSKRDRRSSLGCVDPARFEIRAIRSRKVMTILNWCLVLGTSTTLKVFDV